MFNRLRKLQVEVAKKRPLIQKRVRERAVEELAKEVKQVVRRARNKFGDTCIYLLISFCLFLKNQKISDCLQ